NPVEGKVQRLRTRAQRLVLAGQGGADGVESISDDLQRDFRRPRLRPRVFGDGILEARLEGSDEHINRLARCVPSTFQERRPQASEEGVGLVTSNEQRK